MSDCIFCKIINKEIPSKIVFENDKVIAFHDITPQAPVHVIVIPKEHICCHNALNADNIDIVKDIHLAINEVAKIIGISDSGYRIINNCGADAGQTVMHMHYHVVGGTSLGIKIV